MASALALSACSGGGPTQTVGTCEGGSGKETAGENLLKNPGFENGTDPWITLEPASGFVVSWEQAHSGASSALLKMRDPAGASGAKVYYLVQEMNPAQFPDVLEGYYCVENWNKGTIRQYLQFVVIAIGPDNFPTTAANFQLRYILAGIDSPPFPINNARFIFITKEEPATGNWVHFSANIKEDFERLWGAAPAGYEKLRLLFEVRWDGKAAGDGAPEADVYYDDLYTGLPVGEDP